MTKTIGRLPLLLSILLFTLSACQSQPEQVADVASQLEMGPATQTFMDNLRATGATVSTTIEVTQPFFSVGGIVVRVNGEDLQVFEYPDVASAKADADVISADANNIDGEEYAWIAPPHFYLSGNLMVLYIGDNANTVSLTEEIIGQQFAGY